MRAGENMPRLLSPKFFTYISILHDFYTLSKLLLEFGRLVRLSHLVTTGIFPVTDRKKRAPHEGKILSWKARESFESLLRKFEIEFTSG